jgi:hypothetical protein
MQTLSWRRVGRFAALTLALVVGLPALVQAQLFPNLWIQRKRPACAEEPPFFGHVRHDYYGYYPTCWRKFPEGWACPCPNPEFPDAAKSYAERPRADKSKLPPPIEDFENLDGGIDRGGRAAPGMGDDRGAGDPTLPGATGASPFRGGTPPRPTDPFLPDPAPGPANPSRPANPGRPTNPPRPNDPFDPQPLGLNRTRNDSGPMPRVSSLPSLEGPASEGPRSVTLGGAPSLMDAETDGGTPVLALPSMSAPPPVIAGESLIVSSMPPSLPPTGEFVQPADPAPAPAQAPKRQSLIGGFMNRFRR